MSTSAQIVRLRREAATPPESWVVDLLLESSHMLCFACPLCGRLNTETCVLCQASLCATHDIALCLACNVICQSCWSVY